MDSINISGVTITMEMINKCIHEDTIYTYKQFRKFWGFPEATGNSKPAQLRQLSRCFYFEKVSRGKYLILEIYDHVQPDLKGYTALINILLMRYLKTLDRYTETLSTSMWFDRLGMYNHEYLTYRKYPHLLYDKMTTLEGMGSYRKDMFAVNRNHFCNRVEQYYKQVFKESLEDLHDKKILNYYERVMIYDGTMIREKVSDGSGGYYMHSVPNRRAANITEERAILDIEKSVLDELLKDEDVKSFSYLRFRYPKLVKKYNSECGKRFLDIFGYEENSGAFYTHEYEIVFSDTYLDDQIDEEIANLKMSDLNNKLLNWCNNNAQTHLDYLTRHSEYNKESLKYYRVPVQNELADKCIKIPQ